MAISPLAGIAAKVHPALVGAGSPVCTMVALEQACIPPSSDRRMFVGDHTSLAVEYRPESRPVFAIEAYAVGADDCRQWQSRAPERTLPPALAHVCRAGGDALLLVHPRSRDHYAALLRKPSVRRIESGTFMATPLSSSRSLLVWEEGLRENPFIAKLSLCATIGTVDRTIRATRVAKCVGLTALLDGARDLPGDFAFLDEYYGVSPHRMQRGGMLLRSIPAAVMSGERTLLPAYALIATPDDGTPPLLVTLADLHGMKLGEFAFYALLAPFANQWAALAIDAGIVFESHGQNLMLELDAGLTPTGRLVHRDLEDLSVDLRYRRERGLYVPEALPTLDGHSVDRIYQQRRHRWWLKHSLPVFFEGGVLQPMEIAIARWVRTGLVDSAKVGPRRLRQLFRREIGAALGRYVDRPREIRYDLIDQFVLSARAARGGTAS
jgi:IucA / IucC family